MKYPERAYTANETDYLHEIVVRTVRRYEHIVGREHHVIYASRHRFGTTGVRLKCYS